MPYPAKTSRETILETALEMLEQGQEISMRTLAERLGVKAPSLYRHFADKEALEVAMVHVGNTQLCEQIERSLGRKESRPLARAAKVYLEFARAHPNLYTLMMDARLAALTSAGSGKRLWNLLLRLVGEVSGNLDDTAAAVAVWSFLHGYVRLEATSLFGPSGPRGGFERGLSALIRGLPKGR